VHFEDGIGAFGILIPSGTPAQHIATLLFPAFRILALDSSSEGDQAKCR